MNWLSFSIAIAGLISTIIVSGIGIYFTHKTRTQNYRNLLFHKKLELIIELMEYSQLMELDSDLVISAKSELDRKNYLEIFNEHYLNFAELERKGTIILPVELYVKVSESYRIAQDLVIKFNDNDGEPEDLEEYKASNLQFGLIAREYMGVDKLSTQSIKLFSSKKEISKLANISNDDLTTLVKGIIELRKNNESQN
jgi:hypothetical protein